MEKEKKQEKNKKVKNKIKYDSTNESQELKSFLIVVLVVIVCVGGVYLITRAFVTKDLFKDEEETKEVVEGKVNYDVAIIGQLLNMPEKEYYAVIYDAKEGEHISEMSSLVYNYNALEKHSHVYTIDLSNKLNADYYDPENVNIEAKSVNDLHLGDTTLIKVKDGKIVKYITELDKMKKELGVK